MVDKIILFLQNAIGDSRLVTFISSMIPLIELKGAIPVGVKMGNSLIVSALFAYLGSSFIFFPIYFLLIPIFNLLKKIKFIKNIVLKIEAMLDAKAQKIASKNTTDTDEALNNFLKKSLFIFVAVPFPVTGVWTGTAIAVFLKMKFKDSILPIVLGNLVAGSIVTLLTFLFKDYVDIIIYALFAIVIIMLTITIIKIAKAKPTK